MFEMKAKSLFIEVGHPKTLPARFSPGKAIGEELTCGGEALELQWEFGTLIPHAISLPKDNAANDLNWIGFES